ncbi:Protein-tyrosine-phosphatase [Rasamsonia emersonii CBS 393.64]|uniref:M-phase inducer phosphatase n=1 Tax=Rasamsonia emersonii (strain ATCC 16479 / CBS 393.64 / IMI 116815) TaxID=1408163 RepID=A0A0F4YXS2_RASE3|nr:Protein-tyrosine-phosphatase [Rasamsonia emersonii CBS 393.64]KKA23112.1 Protein-tyrosine-phosphatase [Rasamsonia emersonii CBS 393.64]
MEHSSPLAAMQPPSVLFGHCFRSDASSSCGSFGGMNNFGPNSFNFKDLSMKKSHSDYFSVKPISGSSPAASLAADLSQNFHIDKSPTEETMTTPPLPSSSPAGSMDMMDMSPLPHKVPFNLSTDVQSPSREPSSADSSGPSPLQESPMEDTEPNTPQERKRHNVLRPSLARTKAHSAQLGIPRPAPESQSPPFKFGNGSSNLSTSMSLEDMFDESPQQDRVIGKNGSGNLLGPRLKPPFGGRGSGSPGPGPIRKSSNPFMRPRKQCRRSLSMFEHPDDVVRQKESNSASEPSLQSIIDVEPTYELQLPHFIPEDQPDSLPRIEKSILVDILDGKYNDRFQNIMIIDCRFEYEYEGGHINGAVNYNDKEALAEELFRNPKPGTVLIFHCEYSAHRAPIMASFIRHKDRAFNVDQYPKLTFPEMYILDGGYSAFYAEYRSLCFPQNYVEMTSKEHEYACERGLGKVKQRSKFIRAQTFAFGERSPEMEDSPTGRCRNNDRSRSLECPFGEGSESGRLGRRMLSY